MFLASLLVNCSICFTIASKEDPVLSGQHGSSCCDLPPEPRIFAADGQAKASECTVFNQRHSCNEYRVWQWLFRRQPLRIPASLGTEGLL